MIGISLHALAQKFSVLGAVLLLSALSPAQANTDFLEAEQAFVFSAKQLDARTLEVSYKITAGYYLYHDKFVVSASPNTTQLAAPQIPAGKIKFDENFQKNLETHRDTLRFQVPVQAAAGPFTLTVTSQGCADAGLCYPPMTSEASFNLPVQAGPANTAAPKKKTADAAPSRLNQVFAERSYLGGMALFFGLGLLLTFTPCVLPMVPILSAIIVGQNGAKQSRNFILSLAYVLGMALVYTALGVAAGLIGESLTAALQNPWVLGSFALLLVLLSLSMFGFFELQLPAVWRDKLGAISGRQSGGQLLGVFIMGALSAVIVGPCITAPLAATLAFIANSQDAVFGGTVLLAMALGMGVPLLLVGLGAGSLLPRAGGWMEAVKQFFGVLLLATAIWMITPLLASWLLMSLWAGLLIICASYLRVFDSLPANAPGIQRLAKGVGMILLLLGSLLIIGLASGGRAILQPLAQFKSNQTRAALPFQRLASNAALDQALGNLNGKPALLDFWAEWCVACKEMEHLTFSDPAVAAQLQNFVLLQVDLTDNTPEARALLKRFGLFGPPAIVFFDSAGQKIAGKEVIGFQNAPNFLAHLTGLKTSP